MSPRHAPSKRGQAGAAAVEFAVVAAVFFTMLLGAMEMARLLWTWNAAGEATRRGARMAVVCDMHDAAIKTRMRQMLPALQATNITLSYMPSGCTSANCQTVSVTLTGYTHQPIIPFVPLSIPIPSFQTTLPREFMQSAGNPVCS
ncbi:MAG: pilus assembly protein [Methylibium sp.]|nr:pilus assembly protein [Methylibium sp.]MBA3623173.1 pilus assembly protein [Methylibium sp.]